MNIDWKFFGLSADELEPFLSLGLSSGGDFAEMYLEHRAHSSIRMEEDIIKDTSESVVLGLGVRVLKDEQTGYGYTSDLSQDGIRKAVLSAAAVASSHSTGKVFLPAFNIRQFSSTPIYSKSEPAALSAKILLVQEAYQAAQRISPAVEKVKVSFSDMTQTVIIANSEGLLAGDRRPMVRLACLALAGRDGRREAGFSGGGGRGGTELLKGTMSPSLIGEDAAREALSLLEARPAPAGEMPVVLAPGHSGVLIHEAVGHLLEADFIRKKTSVFWNKIGRSVGSPAVNIYDDPTIPLFRGSYNIDDEGTRPVKTMLVEKGILNGLLQDRLSALILGRPLTGHARRQDFTCYPLPRMSNIYIDRGEYAPEEILRSVKKGFYAERFLGGQVEDSGKFTFSVSFGHLIEDGRLTAPVRQATLIGSNLTILKKIVRTGSDLAFSLQTGTCSKEGQDVPVTDGCPTLKISSMTVGGSLEG